MLKIIQTGLIAFLVLFTSFSFAENPTSSSANVTINNHLLTPNELTQFQQLYGVKPKDGKYWYDAQSGLWGYVGQAPAGFIRPGHSFGTLPVKASAGNTGIFINGRELSLPEAYWWGMLLGVQPLPGRYALNGNGILSGMNAFGVPFAINIAAAAQTRGAGGGWSQGGSIHRSFTTGITSGSQGGCNYVSGSDFTYTGPGC